MIFSHLRSVYRLRVGRLVATWRLGRIYSLTLSQRSQNESFGEVLGELFAGGARAGYVYSIQYLLNSLSVRSSAFHRKRRRPS
jgi:hypothetical protein